MPLVVSVSGAAGTGKSSLLEKIQHKVDDFKVARFVLRDFDIPLYEILKSERQTIKFQEAILDFKIGNDSKLKDPNEKYVFVERCPADFYAFAKTWQQYFDSNTYSEWLKSYHQRCFNAMEFYNITILIPPGKFAHVDDGVRAKANTQNTTHLELDSFLVRRWMHANFNKPRFHLHRLESCDIIERVQEVEKALKDGYEYLDLNGELSGLRKVAGFCFN